MISQVQTLLARAAWAVRAGLSFNGARDLYKVYGYNTTPRHEDFLLKYYRQGFANRVINAPVEAIWSDPPKITKDAAFEQAWKLLNEQHQVYFYLGKADIFAGLGSFALLLIGFDDRVALDKPVVKKPGLKINYFQPYLEGSCAVKRYNEDSGDPRFGLPEIYTITPGETGNRRAAASMLVSRRPFDVHWTRVLHLADNTGENFVFGRSRLEPVYNTLDDLAKVTGGSAETYWLTANRGLHIDIDKEMDLKASDADDLSDEVQEYIHQLSRVIRTRGAKVNALGAEIADPKNVFDVLISELSATTQIPKRVLMGSEAGQLASQQDRANWSNYIAQRVANWGEPIVLRPFIQALQRAGTLPEGHPEIDWPDAYKLNPLERAQTSAQMARSMANAAKSLETAQNMDVQLFTPEEVRNVVSFGKHQPVFGPKPIGTPIPPKPEEDPAQGSFFGNKKPNGLAVEVEH